MFTNIHINKRSLLKILSFAGWFGSVRGSRWKFKYIIKTSKKDCLTHNERSEYSVKLKIGIDLDCYPIKYITKDTW